jgi:SSS family solute:Na+ symporter
MYGLPIIDIVVIGIYFLVMIGIGLWAMGRIKNQEDYFLAGRRFGKFIQTFAAFGQATSADTAIGVSTTTFSNGAAGMWSSLIYLFATPFYWLVMPWMRRLRLLSLGDFFEERYGSKALAGVYAVIGSIGLMAILAVGFTAITKTVVALTPKSVAEFSVQERIEYDTALELEKLKRMDYTLLSEDQKQKLHKAERLQPRKVFSYINPQLVIWLIVFAVMAYALVGGLEAAFITDTIQGIFIIFLSIILIPFALYKISTVYGGQNIFDAFAIMHDHLPESLFEIFGSPTTIDFTWYYIFAIAFMGTLNVVIQPNALIANGSAKDEYTARIGFVTGSFMKRFVTILWGFFALTAILLYSGEVNNPDYVWGYATLDLLGGLKLGLVGLMISCLLAAQMSTADCLMITCSGLLTHNIYRPLFSAKSEKHYIWIGRMSGGLVLIGSALIATQFDSILQILKFMWEVNVMVAASFWLGMKWRRANAKAAWTSIVFTAMVFFVIPALLPQIWISLKTDPLLLKTTHPAPVVRSYEAKEGDVLARKTAISIWEQLPEDRKTSIPKPPPLKISDPFEKTYVLTQKSIFWTKGIKADQNGRVTGSGLINLELLFLDSVGFDLTKNPYALNETIRILIRTITPFLVFFFIALSFRRESNQRIDHFFIKMKTIVSHDPDTDTRELALAFAHPERVNHLKLFPNSDWEFDRWNKEDVLGFVISIGIVLLLIGLMLFIVSVGA